MKLAGVYGLSMKEHGVEDEYMEDGWHAFLWVFACSVHMVT